ncbi:MAG: PHP domain-containing protein [Bacillota bacterium]
MLNIKGRWLLMTLLVGACWFGGIRPEAVIADSPTISFHASPKIVPANQKTEIRITPQSTGYQFSADKDYQIICIPVEYSNQISYYMKCMLENGSLRLTVSFKGEQEYVLHIGERARGVKGSYRKVGIARVYCLEPDLYELRPYKGDLHMHTTNSDGRDTPAFVAATCRKVGLDFIAITDHGGGMGEKKFYASASDALASFKNVNIDLKIFSGEEVHPEGNPTHMVNFGGSFSVNDLIKSNPGKYQKEINVLKEQLGPFPKDINSEMYVSCVWSFNKIREGGGLAILAHPFWLYTWMNSGTGGTGYDYAHYIPEPFFTYMLEKQPFDAYEIVGGISDESNALQVSRYYEERAKGKRIPIVGTSDSHNRKMDGDANIWNYTVVFAKDAELPSLIQEIKKLNSVAVEVIPGETPRVHGPYRLVKYTMFLMREVLAEHDAVCLKEGKMMLRHINGERGAADQLKKSKGESARALEKHWTK